MKENASHWYEDLAPSQHDKNGALIVGYKWTEVRPGKSLLFTIIRQSNGDFIVTCDQASLSASNLAYKPCTIYASQAQTMPAQVIWSIILEGLKDF